jgi:OOP family OmpA-OmpF porin
VSQAVASGPLLFRIASATLTPESNATLDKVAAAINACPNQKLAIGGHTDSDGDAGANQALSEQRAAAVVAYLQKAGVSADRMTATGFGATKPIAANDTAENKRLNRRIEIIVTN